MADPSIDSRQLAQQLDRILGERGLRVHELSHRQAMDLLRLGRPAGISLREETALMNRMGTDAYIEARRTFGCDWSRIRALAKEAVNG